MNDIFGFGKMLPIDKLIDIVISATGRISKPYFDKKDIDTKAYEIKKLAEAHAEEMKIISKAIKDNSLLSSSIEYNDSSLKVISTSEDKFSELTILSLEERTKERINFKDIKKQLNIESVTAYAADELKSEESVTDEPVDEDWKTRFFNIAEDISNEEMQVLWGRILAGEIKKPNTYSLRTLELLKNLTKEEAEVFTKFAKLKISDGHQNFIYNPQNGKFIEEEFGLNFSDRLLLSDLGLIYSEISLGLNYKPTENGVLTNVLNYGKKGIFLIRKEQTPKQLIECLVFTKIGVELSGLIEQDYNKNYVEKICANFKVPTVEVSYGDLIQNENGSFSLINKVYYE